MKLEVKRKWETDKSICGELWIDGQFENFTLEPAREFPVHLGHPCVPAGTYKVALTFSPHFQTVTPEVLDVPGRSEIRVHFGNRPSDSLGCTLVGSGHTENWVSNSRATFDKLMVLLKTADEITITYSEKEQS